jgi:hypothetical protein
VHSFRLPLSLAPPCFRRPRGHLFISRVCCRATARVIVRLTLRTVAVGQAPSAFVVLFRLILSNLVRSLQRQWKSALRCDEAIASACGSLQKHEPCRKPINKGHEVGSYRCLLPFHAPVAFFLPLLSLALPHVRRSRCAAETAEPERKMRTLREAQPPRKPSVPFAWSSVQCSLRRMPLLVCALLQAPTALFLARAQWATSLPVRRRTAHPIVCLSFTHACLLALLVCT